MLLQEVTHKLCETLSMVANIGITHPDYILIKKTNDLASPGRQEGEEGQGRTEDLIRVGSASDADSAPVAINEDSSLEVPVESGDVVTTQPVVGVETSSRDGGTEGEGPGEEGRGRSGDAVKVNEKLEERSAAEDLLQPTMQALAVLSNVSAPETGGIKIIPDLVMCCNTIDF